MRLSILQCADDTILFIDHNLEKALNMKLILCTFKQLLELRINFCKSEITYFGQAKEVQYRDISVVK
jgi:hypothetical protein